MLVETQYLPPIATFVTAVKDNCLLVEAHENYQKKSYRNKCQILGSNGPISLSIPLRKGKHQQKSIKDVQISYDEDWFNKHVQSIKSAYQSAPFYDYYCEPIFDAILTKHKNLYDLNYQILSHLCHLLGLEIKETDQYNLEHTYDFRSTFTPSKRKDFKLEPYMQVFSDRFTFESNLSIIDLLFCKGPESRYYLEQQTIEQ